MPPFVAICDFSIVHQFELFTLSGLKEIVFTRMTGREKAKAAGVDIGVQRLSAVGM